MTTITIDRAIVEQALEALERYQVKRQDFDRFADEITVLRAALADHSGDATEMVTTSQKSRHAEPVAWLESPHGSIRANPNYKFTFPSQLLHWQIPLYTATPKADPVQEPVAWGAFYFGGNRNGKLYSHCDTQAQIEAYIADRHRSDDSNTFRAAPLYTAPPKRNPLTDEEIHDCFQQSGKTKAETRRRITRAIERAHGIGANNE